MPDTDQDISDEEAEQKRLGAQYREAKASIAAHRRTQAAAEVAHGRLVRLLGPDHDDVNDAYMDVLGAHEAVLWCKAVTVAAGEAYKGCTLAEADERNEVNRAQLAASRQRAMDALTGDGGS